MRSLIFLLAVFLAINAATISPTNPSHEMSPEVRHRLVKAHGILMVLAWLFLVPSGILFARMLRDAFKNRKPFGLAIWFHVHRGFNIIALVLMGASFLCIFISTGWKWKGVGSHAKNSTQLHTTTGVVAFALAIAQPFLAWLRCGPNHPRRPLFNWSHRLIGVIAYICAMIAFVVAATEFKKLWTDAVLQTILMVLPSVLLLVLWPLTQLWLPREDHENKNETGYSLRLSLCFWATGMMLATSIAVSLLIAAGYKPK